VLNGALATGSGSQDLDPIEGLGDKEVVGSQLREPTPSPKPHVGSQLPEATSDLENQDALGPSSRRPLQALRTKMPRVLAPGGHFGSGESRCLWGPAPRGRFGSRGPRVLESRTNGGRCPDPPGRVPTIQRSIYYISEVLHDAKTRYLEVHKLLYAFLITSMKHHYFQAHKISVVISYPLKVVLHRPNATRNIAKWEAELAEFELDFLPCHAVKS
jgi:hypothetical protein